MQTMLQRDHDHVVAHLDLVAAARDQDLMAAGDAAPVSYTHLSSGWTFWTMQAGVMNCWKMQAWPGRFPTLPGKTWIFVPYAGFELQILLQITQLTHGCGEFILSLIHIWQLSEEDHNVTIVDTNKARVEHLTESYDVLAQALPEAQILCDMWIRDRFQTNITTIAICLAAVVAILIWVVLNKTTFGYELKAVGLNKSAARYAGIDVYKRQR